MRTDMRQLILALACVAALLTLHALDRPVRPDDRPLLRDPQKVAELFQQVCFTAIAAVGMTLVIVRGGIDISIGSMLAVCGIAGAGLAKAGWSPPAVVGVSMAIGAGLGALNAAIILLLRIPPIIATLGTMTLLRGLVVELGPRDWVRELPPAFRLLGTGHVWPPALLIAALVAAEAFSRWTALGRSIYLLGNNDKAARVCGVSAWKTDLFVYSLCGLLVGLAAMVRVAYVNQAETRDGEGFEMDVIAAVVLGGTNIFGGEGTVYGSVLGAFFFKLMTRVLVALGVSGQWDWVVTGATILAIVGIDQLARRLREERARLRPRAERSVAPVR